MGIITKVLGVLGGLVGLAQSYFTGKAREKDRDAGRKDERLRTLEGSIGAAKRKKELEHEASRLDDADRRDRLSRFMRDKPDDESGK